MPCNERLLVFDDVSDMVSAQRAQAWGEVARRLAHEIKNPLTPIQLSAERLAMKLQGKVQPAEQALLDKSVRTIVDQVDAMKRLVNEFRDYARLPAAELVPTDLNALVRDILVLYEHTRCVPVVTELADDCPLVMADAQQVRQIIHNLVQNAQDAMAGQSGVTRVDANPPLGLGALGAACPSSTRGRVFPTTSSKEPLSPMSPPSPKAPGLGWPWSRKSWKNTVGVWTFDNRLIDGKVSGAQVSLSFAVAN